MKRVFLSFKMDDKKQVDGIRLLAWHKYVDLEFYDESVRSPYRSETASYIKSKIRPKISRSSVALCLLGRNTHQSDWVNWEMSTAIELNKKIVIMGLPKGPDRLILPDALKSRVWYTWDIALLQNLIESP